MDTFSNKLSEYAGKDIYPFHMPGHKRLGGGVYGIDITEIDGFDNLHNPQGIIKDEMDYASQFYGTARTFFLVGGSTVGILAAISAAIPRNGRLLIDRDAHISVYHAAEILGIEIIYIDENEKKPDGPHGLNGVLITSPTYEGYVKDVAAWADFAAERDIPLIVDEAHGAHFSRHPYFPKSAIELGADIVIESAHKTLPAMTQTALLHNVTGWIESERIQHFLDVYETSSPSYVLLSSLISAVHFISEGGRKAFCAYAERLKALRAELKQLNHFILIGEDRPSRYDRGKILIRCGNGVELSGRLRRDYAIESEMSGENFVLLMTSVYDTDEGFRRLKDAMRALDEDEEAVSACGIQDISCVKSTSRMAPVIDIPRQRAIDIVSAEGKPAEEVPIYRAVGRISATYVTVYPPDRPVVIPGETISLEAVAFIAKRINSGADIMGIGENQSILCLTCQ